MSRKIKPPKTWKDIESHYLNVIESDWYRLLVNLEDLINVETYNFYQKKKMKTMHLPITTGTISSPMGRGSDSIPVNMGVRSSPDYNPSKLLG